MYAIQFDREERLHRVGYFNPDGTWRTLQEFTNSDHACLFIRWLNGGDMSQAAPPTYPQKINLVDHLPSLFDLPVQTFTENSGDGG